MIKQTSVNIHCCQVYIRTYVMKLDYPKWYVSSIFEHAKYSLHYFFT
jgi:hypothetical protein